VAAGGLITIQLLGFAKPLVNRKKEDLLFPYNQFMVCDQPTDSP
jgi:hypothetical protein